MNPKKWTGKIKATYIEIPEDLHHAMRVAGLHLGLKSGEAYIEAATRWLEQLEAQRKRRRSHGD